MSLIDTVRGKLQDIKQHREETNQRRGKRLAHMPVEYTGGYKEYDRSPAGIFAIYENAVAFQPPFGKNAFEVSKENIANIFVEGSDEVRKRVTMTRILLLNIFALAAQKTMHSREAFITVVDKDGLEAIFYVKNCSPAQVKRMLGGAQAAIMQSAVKV